MSKLLVSVSGIRGIVGEALTAEVALNYGRAFGRFVKGGKVVMGRDTRHHGPMILHATVSGLLDVGCQVIDLGVVTTPTVEYAVRNMGADGGIIITASHNPIAYNALKLIGPGGIFLTEKQGKRFLRISAQPAHGKTARYGNYSSEEGWESKHIDAILSLDIIDVAQIKKRRFRVVCDCVNGTASFMVSELFHSLGCSLKLINAVPDGSFPHPPEPAPENLGSLCRAVKSSRADVGFAFDPDSDRLAIVDETGRAIGEEYTLALGLRHILRKKRGPVAVNLSSSMINDFVAREAGVRLYRTKVGEVNTTEKLLRVGGVAGGEGNGGLIYPGIHSGRDAIQASAIILGYMATTRRKISELVADLPKTYMVKRKVETEGKIIDFAKIKRTYAGQKIDEKDGLKILFKDAWVQIRLSNTEPIARIMAEAYEYNKAGQLADVMASLIK